jgi:adenosylhomocysteine nucleosidase
MLFEKFAADLVDMEAAAVARHAARHQLPFYAVKAISDPAHANLPDFGPYIRDGEFRTAAFIAHVALRPWYWPALARLQRHSAQATAALARELADWIAVGGPPARRTQTSSSAR